MERTVVQIARVRIADLRHGDVVNAHPEHEHGWFVVQAVRQLPSGDLVASGDTSIQAVKGQPFDLVGLQVTKTVDLPVSLLADASAN